MLSFDQNKGFPSIESVDDLLNNTRSVDEHIDLSKRLDAWWMVQSGSKKGHISRESRKPSETKKDGDDGHKFRRAAQ